MMNETTLTKTKRKSNSEFESVADQLLEDMKRLNEQMQNNRVEIDYLRAETARLEAENQVVLSRLKAMW